MSSCLARIWHPFDYSALDEQIAKFRQLAAEYRQDNVAYYGEYLSSILFGDEYPEARDARPAFLPGDTDIKKSPRFQAAGR